MSNAEKIGGERANNLDVCQVLSTTFSSPGVQASRVPNLKVHKTLDTCGKTNGKMVEK